MSENSVKYLIIGGYAVGYYGVPHMTRDLDIWVDTASSNAEAILAALKDFGIRYMFRESFETPDNVVQLGEPPDRIDILTSVNGIGFQEAYPHRESLLLDDLIIPFIDAESLVKAKTGTGRARDLADVEDLRRRDA